MKKIYLALTSTLLLTGCATPETRVRNGLVQAGLPKPIAGCMADRMVDRLSLGQLLKFRGLSKLRGKDPRDITIEEFVKRTKSLQDPEILGVTTSSAAICAAESVI